MFTFHIRQTAILYFIVQSYVCSDCRDDVFCCEVSPSSKVVAVGTSKGIVKIYDVMDGRHLYTLVDVGVRRSYLPAVSCSWISDERILVGYASGSIKVITTHLQAVNVLYRPFKYIFIDLEYFKSRMPPDYRREPDCSPNMRYSIKRCVYNLRKGLRHTYLQVFTRFYLIFD